MVFCSFGFLSTFSGIRATTEFSFQSGNSADGALQTLVPTYTCCYMKCHQRYCLVPGAKISHMCFEDFNMHHHDRRSDSSVSTCPIQTSGAAAADRSKALDWARLTTMLRVLQTGPNRILGADVFLTNPLCNPPLASVEQHWAMLGIAERSETLCLPTELSV
jgi:hypothetical protein